MVPRSVFVIGDSISMFYGPHLQRMLGDDFAYDRKRAAETAPIDPNKPEGANGGDSSQVLGYLEEQKAKGVSYDILLLNSGLHDISTNRETKLIKIDLENYRKNLVSILVTARSMATVVIWISTTPVIDWQVKVYKKSDRFNADVIAYNTAACSVMSEHQIRIIDLYTYTSNLGDQLQFDGVHFKPEIARLQAAYIAGWLTAAFMEPV